MAAVADVAALQSALAAEQAIVYGYGIVGAHLSGRAQRYAAACLRGHERRRDELGRLVLAARLTPTPAPPAYQVPVPVGAGQARGLAAQLEAGGAGAAWDLVAASAPASAARRLAIAWLSEAAVHIADWGAAVPPLPGQPV